MEYLAEGERLELSRPFGRRISSAVAYQFAYPSSIKFSIHIHTGSKPSNILRFEPGCKALESKTYLRRGSRVGFALHERRFRGGVLASGVGEGLLGRDFTVFVVVGGERLSVVGLARES